MGMVLATVYEIHDLTLAAKVKLQITLLDALEIAIFGLAIPIATADEGAGKKEACK